MSGPKGIRGSNPTATWRDEVSEAFETTAEEVQEVVAEIVTRKVRIEVHPITLARVNQAEVERTLVGKMGEVEIAWGENGSVSPGYFRFMEGGQSRFGRIPEWWIS